MIEFSVDEDAAGMRLDKYLRRKLDQVPASHLFKMIRTKKVRINGKRAQPEQILSAGDRLELSHPSRAASLRCPRSADSIIATSVARRSRGAQDLAVTS